MAIASSAKKAIKVAKRRRTFNMARKDILKNAMKEVKKLIANGDKKGAEVALKKAYKELDKTAKSKLIKKGNASRRKSRLAKQIAKIK